MTVKGAITRWKKYLRRIQSLLDDISKKLQNGNFVDSSDVIALLCLYAQLCKVRSYAELALKVMNTHLYHKRKDITDDESENS